jgi:alanine racemase
MVDVTNVVGIKPGDEVVLIGKQGMEEIFVAEVAERAGTVAWEIFTGIGSRVRRVYL